ncbi:MAG: GNAT family N-acetyltransferase [Verrucomicrobia bacterium]|nr:GNAT family N-acetyltransferase [Verrucomicrobiota bacterium]
MTFPPWINEEFDVPRLPPEKMDLLWAAGWRRFGQKLFRYSLTLSESGDLDIIVPLRLTVSEFTASKSQRRVIKINSDLTWEIRPASLSSEVIELFEKHRSRFKNNAPDSLALFLGDDPANSSCECLELRCLLRGHLIAASFLDIGARSVSSVYALFDPAESRRSLGILTFLKEIEWAREHGKTFLHPGYSTLGPGVYDYKKQFRPLQGFDWSIERWMPWNYFAEHSLSFRITKEPTA